MLDIESKIVSPARPYILSEKVPGFREGMSKQIASKTLVDEA